MAKAKTMTIAEKDNFMSQLKEFRGKVSGIIIPRQKPMTEQIPNVFIASSNKLKQLAAYDALANKTLNGVTFEEFELNYYAPPSGVNNQPFGEKETLVGAVNRCLSCPESVLIENFCVVGIESGNIFDEEQQKYYEIVAVCVNCNGTVYTYVGYEFVIEIPEKYYGLMAQVKDSNYSTTFGELIDKEIGCKPNQWHSIVTNGKMSREKQIRLTLDALITHLQH